LELLVLWRQKVLEKVSEITPARGHHGSAEHTSPSVLTYINALSDLSYFIRVSPRGFV
jgi:hypothetical protein